MNLITSSDVDKHLVVNGRPIDINDCYGFNDVLYYDGKPLLDKTGAEIQITNDIQYTSYIGSLNSNDGEENKEA